MGQDQQKIVAVDRGKSALFAQILRDLREHSYPNHLMVFDGMGDDTHGFRYCSYEGTAERTATPGAATAQFNEGRKQ